MTLPKRFSGPVLTNAVLHQTAFADHDFDKRMTALRLKIEHIRNSWPSDESYLKLMTRLKSIIELEKLEPEDLKFVQNKLNRILEEFHDYADTTHRDSAVTQAQQYHAVELYCSEPGYDCIYSAISRALRQPNASDDLLTAAVALVELVTIDLYNLRLSNLGDAQYSNFQGIVFRCFRVTSQDVEKYKSITQLPNIKGRHFSIPLGLCSSSTDETRAMKFLDNVEPGQHAMIWKVHVHGMDQDLLREYLKKYPDSVVTSICAMPVAHLSPFGEREILLRGSFFQAIQMSEEVHEGRFLHRIELVTINANRDHTTERASNQGQKAEQRDMFRLLAEASRYEVSASISKQCGLDVESAKYEELQAQTHIELEGMFGFPLKRNRDLAAARSRPKQTWLGASEYSSYPSHYAELRRGWQDAVSHGDWITASKILQQEYDWCKNDWFNVAKLQYDNDQPERFGLTFLHEFALHKDPPSGDEERAAQEELIRLISAPEVWKTVRSFDDRAVTAYELAQQAGNEEVAQILKPKIIHDIPSETIESLERQLHHFMHEKAGEYIRKPNFRLPQISILTEMQCPELWVPNPHMYGGFAIDMHDDKLLVTMFETIPGRNQPGRTEIVLVA